MMAAGTTAYQICRPPSAVVVHAACCSSSTAQNAFALSRASLGGANSRGYHGLATGNIQRKSSSKFRVTIIVRAEVLKPQSTPILSPFEEKEEEEEEKGGLYSADVYDELNAENVDLVLNEVRPYLISDGGNVQVASVDDGVVSLRLQGACGTCPSSTTTMKMGIERVLNEKFGAFLKGVVQVDQQQTGATVMGVDSHLEMLRPAIHNYGGFVQVVSVSTDTGVAVIKYKGPPPIAMGIQAAIKDKFPDIKEVVLVDEHHA